MNEMTCEDDAHDIDWNSVKHAYSGESEAVVDVWCRTCGKSGSIPIAHTDINW